MKPILLFLLLLVPSLGMGAQVILRNQTNSPSSLQSPSNAIVGTAAQNAAITPTVLETGDVRIDTDTQNEYKWNGSAWVFRGNLGTPTFTPTTTPTNTPSSTPTATSTYTPTTTPTFTPTFTATATPTFTPLSETIVQNYSVNVQQAASYLKNYRNAYTNMKNNQGTRCKILVAGDSTEAGAEAQIPTGDGFSGCATLAPPYVLSWLLTNHGMAAYNSSRLTSTYGNAYDPRSTWGSGWGTGGTPECLAGNLAVNSTTQNTLDFAPGNTCDTFQVLYAQTTSAGTFSLTIDSGTPVTFNSYGTAAIASAAVSTTVGTHTLHIKMLTTAMFWSAIMAYNQTTPYVEILNAGGGGWETSNFISSTSVWDSLPEIEYIAPNLTIIELYINDAANSVSSSTYKANLQTLITACQLSGDVIIVTGNPNNNSTVNAAYPAYLADMISLAQTNNCLFFDTQQRFGTWANANGLGWMYDQYHPNRLGYLEKAEAFFYFLNQFEN